MKKTLSRCDLNMTYQFPPLRNPDWQPFWNTTVVPRLNQIKISGSVCPPPETVFHIFELVSPRDIKVLLIGQDPYHTPGKRTDYPFPVVRVILSLH